MGFQLGGSLLDFIVLSLLKSKDEYGYMLTQEVRKILDISEMAMYPALKRLQKNEMLSVYDVPCQGRNRRYYHLTEQGERAWLQYQKEWELMKTEIDRLLEEEKDGDM